MPRTEAQFEEIREQKISLIIQTALELFAGEGFHPTSISRIAQKAGISKGLMYNYFESKEALILAVIGKGIEKLTASIDPDKDGFLTSEEFEFHVNENFRILQENTEYWKLYFATMMQPEVFRLISIKYKDLLPHRLEVIEDYFRRKGIREPESEACYFDAMLDGVFLNYVMDPDGFPLEKIKVMILNRFK